MAPHPRFSASKNESANQSQDYFTPKAVSKGRSPQACQVGV